MKDLSRTGGMTMEEIMAVSRLDEQNEDDEVIADEPAIPSHSEAYACLSTCIR